MSRLTRASWLTALLIVSLLVAVTGWLAAAFYLNDDNNLLPPRTPGEWIVYDGVPQLLMRPAVEVPTTFRRRFALERVPQQAVLKLSAPHVIAVQLNGEVLSDVPRHRGWKRPIEIDVGPQLHAGENELEITASHDRGPAVAWAVLEADGVSIATDTSWEASAGGAAWRPARPVSEPLRFVGIDPAAVMGAPGSDFAAGDRAPSLDKGAAPKAAAFRSPWEAVAVVWPWWLLLGALAAAGAMVFALADRRNALVLGLPLGDALLLGACGLLWIALVWHNIDLLPRKAGYDAPQHLDYVQYIQDHGALPLADQGWEFYHPPLYYLIAAGLLQITGQTTATAGGAIVLRLFGAVAGISLFCLVCASLRIVLPGRPQAQRVGLVLAAFLPAPLFLAQYPTNELLSATLSAAAVYLALRALAMPRPGAGIHLAVGACLGAAVLTKFTPMALVAAVLIVFAGRLVARREFRPGAWLQSVGPIVLGCVAVSGWYYASNVIHFGTPLPANVDVAFPSWQDPGYRTPRYFFALGDSLSRTYFAGVDRFADGIYNTLWGDGFLGGTSLSFLPPWNHDWLAAGLVLALVPTALVSIGAVVSLIELVRRPTASWYLLWGVLAGVLLVLFSMACRWPYYSFLKGFFALPALVACCALAAVGYDFFARRSVALGLAACTLLGVWALNAYASYWIIADSPDTRLVLAFEALAAGRRDDAIAEYQALVHDHPQLPRVWYAFGSALAQLRHPREAEQVLRRAMELDPSSGDVQAAMALVVGQQGRLDEAISWARQAVESGTRERPPFYLLAQLLEQQGDLEAALPAYREAVRELPTQADVYRRLGSVARRLGQPHEALKALRLAVAIEGHDPLARYELGRTLAQLGDLDAAAEEMSAATAQNRDLLAARYYQAVLADALGPSADVIRSYRAVLGYDPQHEPARVGLALRLLRDGRLRDAEAELRRALQQNPGNAVARQALAIVEGVDARDPAEDAKSLSDDARAAVDRFRRRQIDAAIYADVRQTGDMVGTANGVRP